MVMAMGLPRMMCFPARAASMVQRGDLGDRRGDVDDVDVGAVEEGGVVGVVVDAEGPGELLPLGLLRPGDRDQLRPGVVGQGPGQAVARVPVPEAQDADPPLLPRLRPLPCPAGHVTPSPRASRVVHEGVGKAPCERIVLHLHPVLWYMRPGTRASCAASGRSKILYASRPTPEEAHMRPLAVLAVVLLAGAPAAAQDLGTLGPGGRIYVGADYYPEHWPQGAVGLRRGADEGGRLQRRPPGGVRLGAHGAGGGPVRLRAGWTRPSRPSPPGTSR